MGSAPAGPEGLTPAKDSFELDVLQRPEKGRHLEAVDFRLDLACTYFGATL
jgi:hypothetical protein